MRLSQFRESNTDEKSPLNFFEQHDKILLIPLEATNSLETMVEKVKSVIGKPHLYGLSIAEVERQKIATEREVTKGS